MDLFAFDDDYVRRLRARDRETEVHFHGYFRDLLLIKLRKRLATAEAIEDVRQTVFARVYEKLDELRDGRKLGAFVNQFCENVLKEHYRSEARAARVDAPPPPDVPSKEDEMVIEERRRRVLRILDRMDKRDADILRALFLEERSKDEVCALFGVRRDYLRVILFRARKDFQEEFRRKSTPNFLVTISGQSPLSL
jgi:RNA polymerase sigma-70 factor (ECF subfamily)